MNTRHIIRNWHIVTIVILCASVFLRVYNIDIPQEQVFDEVYFPVFANHYLQGTDFFDAHPPAGKLAIAVGIAAFGNNPLGWRIMNALAGLALLGVVYGFTYDLTKRHRAATLALLLVAIDPMALVESRIGLINIYLALFSILGLWFYWRWWREDNPRTRDLAIAIASFALATGVKWVGAGAIASALLFSLVMLTFKKSRLSSNRLRDIPLFLIFPLVYFATFIPDILRGQNIQWWHENAFLYHAHLTADHPYGSSWWSWAITERPVWFYYKTLAPGVIRGIINIGNLVTWTAGLLAAFFSLQQLPRLWQTKSDTFERNTYLLLTYLALYLPWIAISRVKFIYHYFVPVLLLLIILAIFLDEVVLADRNYRWLAYVIIALGIAFFIYFLPLLLGTPLSIESYRNHMWFPSWI